VEQIGEKQIKLAQYRYENCRINSNTEVNIIAAWAWGLCMLKRYDEAEAKIKDGVARHKRAGRIYVIWGSLLAQLGKPEDALEKLNKALEQVTRNESITRISNIYSSMGNCYAKLGQIEVARNYMQKAIQADPNSSRGYYNLAMLHLSSKDENQFFELLEDALGRGFQKQNIVKDPRCANMMQHPRMVRLMDKYSGE
jgi:tetratricopeptide (TPR) repeat protein